MVILGLVTTFAGCFFSDVTIAGVSIGSAGIGFIITGGMIYLAGKK